MSNDGSFRGATDRISKSRTDNSVFGQYWVNSGHPQLKHETTVKKFADKTYLQIRIGLLNVI